MDLKNGFIYFNVQGTCAFIWCGGDSQLDPPAFTFEWREERATYELLFGSSAWEGLFKSSQLVRDYLDLVLRNLISYKNKVDNLLS